MSSDNQPLGSTTTPDFLQMFPHPGPQPAQPAHPAPPPGDPARDTWVLQEAAYTTWCTNDRLHAIARLLQTLVLLAESGAPPAALITPTAALATRLAIAVLSDTRKDQIEKARIAELFRDARGG